MSIRKELASGIFYTSLAKYSGIAISLVITAILSRLLTPEDFGIVAVATVIIAFFNILGDIGIGPAIIQRQNLSQIDYRSIFSTTLIIGFALSLLFFLAAPFIANYYADNELTTICRYLSLTIFFTCINIVPLNLQYKAKNFKKVGLVTLSVQILAGISSILYALKGGGAYALVLSSVISTATLAAIYIYLSKLVPTIHIRKSSINKIFSFSVYQALFNIINYFTRNLDKLLIGKYIGLNQLGYYEKSYRLMMMPLQNITFVITPVILPVFISLHDNVTAMISKYNKLLEILAFIAFPLTVLMFFCAEEIILLFFGNQWREAVSPFRILSITIALQMLMSSTGSIYQAVDRTKELFITGCWGAFFMIASFLITIFGWGTVKAVCIGYVFAQLANSIQTFTFLYRTIECPITDMLKHMKSPIIIAIILTVVLAVTSFFVKDISMLLSILIKGCVWSVCYLILLHFLSPFDFRQLKQQGLKNYILHFVN